VDAVGCAERRERAYERRRSVLVHGDVHEANALQAGDGTFKLIDPVGLRAEPACDLGTIVRCTPDVGDDLRARADRLAARTGVDATAIWEWGTVHRVIGGLNAARIGFSPSATSFSPRPIDSRVPADARRRCARTQVGPQRERDREAARDVRMGGSRDSGVGTPWAPTGCHAASTETHARASGQTEEETGAPGGIRTPDPQVRRI
jgi:hypothetical protein